MKSKIHNIIYNNNPFVLILKLFLLIIIIKFIYINLMQNTTSKNQIVLYTASYCPYCKDF